MYLRGIMPLSAYELEREAKIRQNKAVISRLGLDQFSSAPPKPSAKRARPKSERKRRQGSRRSLRTQTARRSTRSSNSSGRSIKLLSLGQKPLSPKKPVGKRAGSSIGHSGGGRGEDEADDEADEGHSWDELEAAFAAVRGSKVDHLSAHSNVRFGEETKKTCQVCLTKLKGAKQRYCVTITKGLHEQLEKSTKKVGRLQLTSATRRDQKATSHHGRHEFYVVASSKKIPAAALAAEVCLARKEMEGH